MLLINTLIMSSHGISMRMESMAAFASLFGVTTISATAFAEQPIHIDTAMNERHNGVEVMMVTARKKEERILDVPLSVSMFDDTFLASRDIDTVEDLARFTPGFDHAQAFGRQDFRPAIRGQSSIIGGANAGLFLDGFYVGFGEASLPTQALQRVEVIKGPQSAVYGRATLAGAVNYVFKQPSASLESDIEVSVGEYGTRALNSLVSGPISDRWGYLFAFSHDETEGQYRNRFPGNAAGADAQSGRLGEEQSNAVTGLVRYEADKLAGQFHLVWQRSEDGQYAVGLLPSSENNCGFGPAPQPPENTPGAGEIALFPGFSIPVTGSGYNNSGYYCGEVDVGSWLDERGGAGHFETGFFEGHGIDNEAIRAGFTIEWQGDSMQLHSKTSYHEHRRTVKEDQSFGGGDFFLQGRDLTPARFGLLSHHTGDAKEYSQEWALAAQYGDKLDYRVGVYLYEGHYERAERTSNLAGPVPEAVSMPRFVLMPEYERRTNNYAVFSALEYKLSERFNVALELRYSRDQLDISGEHFDYEAAFSEWLPRFTLDWQVRSDTHAYAMASKGNKPGDFNSRSGLRDEERVVQEETAWNYELGMKKRFLGERAFLSTALFYIDWENQQLTTTTETEEGFAASILENVGKSEVQGWELSVLATLNSIWKSGLSYSYIDTEIKTFRLDAQQHRGQFGMLSGFEEAAQLGFPYAQDGDVLISGTELPQVSKHQFNWHNTFEIPIRTRWKVFGQLDYQYASKKYAQVYNKAHTGNANKIDMSMGIRTTSIEWKFWVKNLTDDQTSPALIRFIQLNDGTSNPVNRAIGFTLPSKRMAGATVKYHF